MEKSHLDLGISCKENPTGNSLKFSDLDGKILEKIPPWMRISIRNSCPGWVFFLAGILIIFLV